MSIRTILAVFVALAVLVAPAFGRAGEAFAAVPDHQAQMMETGHCHMPPSGSGDHDKAPAKSCCMSMSMAVAIAPSAPVRDKLARAAPPASGPAIFHVSSPTELATPPPKLS